MIGARLHAVASMVLPDRPVADVACDHARLAISLVACGVVPHAIASDVASAPLDAARANVARAGLRERVRLMQADGLSGLQPGEVATVCICGVGPGRPSPSPRPPRASACSAWSSRRTKACHASERRSPRMAGRSWTSAASRAGGPSRWPSNLNPRRGARATSADRTAPARTADEAARAWWRGQRDWRIEAGTRFAEQIAWLDEALQDTTPLA